MASDSAAEDRLGGATLLEPGRVLEGRYEVGDYIGAGAFAAVYSGRQLNIERAVAIKVLNVVNAWQDAQTRRAFGDRFLREAQTAAQIKHPNVVDIYDYGIITDLGQPFIVMELLHGWDLQAELAKNGPMDAPRVWRLMLGALEALGEGHERGIVHKDLKPSNLFMVNPGGRREVLKVVDFGIARVKDAEEGQRLTGTGQIFGTPQYLAPEYIEKQVATPALDVYQMALILVEMLTGKTVVDIDNPYKCLMIHVSGELPLPPALMAGPAGEVLRKALHKDWQQRYADASAFADALRTVDPEQVRVEGVVTGEARMQLIGAPTLTPSELTPLGTVPPGASAGGYEDALESNAGRPRGLWVVGLAAAVLVLGAGAALAVSLMGPKELPRDPALVAERPVTAAVEPPETAAVEPPASLAAVERPVTAAEAPAAVEVEVRTVPAGAEVFVGGESRGASPVQVRFEGDAPAVEVEVRKSGYVAATREVSPKDRDGVELRLEKEEVRGGHAPIERVVSAPPASAQPPATVATRPASAEPKGDGKTTATRRGGMGFVEEGGKKPDGKGGKGIGFVE